MAPGEIRPHAARFRSRGSGSKSVTGVYDESFSSFGSLLSGSAIGASWNAAIAQEPATLPPGAE